MVNNLFSVSRCLRGEKDLARGLDWHGFWHAAAQPPDQPAGDDQENRNQLRASHHSPEDRTAPGIIADEFQEVACDPIEDEISSKNLSIKLLAVEHPSQDEEIRQLNSGFKKLRRRDRFIQWGANYSVRNRVGKRHPPEVMRRLPIAAASGKTAYPSNRVPERQSRSKSIAGGQWRHVVSADVPGRRGQGAD